jgi:hypothetical protein
VSSVGILHTSAGNALDAAELVADGEPPTVGWSFGVLQTLDDYTSTYRRSGAELDRSGRAGVFTDPPAPTASVELDAAFAALAEYLAERDGWTPPAWTSDAWRSVAPAVWWASTPSIFRDIAMEPRKAVAAQHAPACALRCDQAVDQASGVRRQAPGARRSTPRPRVDPSVEPVA